MAFRALPLVAAARRAVTAGLVGLCGVTAAGGCVEAFDGSNLQIDFAMGTLAAARPGRPLQPDQPPADTHLELYAADLVYQTNPDGTVVVDERGRPLVEQSFLFKVTEFEIRPAIDTSSPCLIELGDTQYPGLHVTQIASKVEEILEPFGTDDPFAPGLPADVVTDVLNARRRFGNLEKIETILKAVTSHEAFRYPATAPAGQCPPSSPDALPDRACKDDASNAQRLRVCQALWAAHPEFYEGSDKVFTLPLNGRYLGMVEGMNPINMGFVGGSSMFVDENLIDHEAYILNWQYDDFDGDGTPDFPPALPAAERLDLGYLYMSGAPVDVSRGVTTVPLRHPTNANINADLAILPNLGHDDVHF